MRTSILGWTLWTLAASAHAQATDPDVRTLDASLRATVPSLNPDYLLFSPKEKPSSKVPLVIYLHGSGGVGQDVRRLRAQAAPVWRGIAKFGKGPAYVAVPQCLKRPRDGERGGWIPADLDVLLAHLKRKLPIDETRIYLTGNSMGGYGSWAWGAHSPENFAAIAPVVGGIGRGGPKDVTPDLDKWASNLKQVPVYAFAGGKDRVVPAERSERMVAAIRKAGGTNAKLKVYPNEGHRAGRVVYASAELYDWMFSKKRD